MMRSVWLVVAVFVLVLGLCAAVSAQDPVRWSAPMDQYPNQWNPTQAPPNYQEYNYWYGSYPQYGYGAGAQVGSYPSWGYGGNYGGYAPQGFSGNPYSRGFY